MKSHRIAAHMARNARADTPADVASRAAHRAALAQAYTDTIARFGDITPANAAEFAAFQSARTAQLVAPLFTRSLR